MMEVAHLEYYGWECNFCGKWFKAEDSPGKKRFREQFPYAQTQMGCTKCTLGEEWPV